MQPTFRNDLQPWIPVLFRDGSSGEVSLTDAFKRSDEIRRLGGSPTEVASIFRFLMAIAHLTETPKDYAAWSALWSKPRDFMKRCIQYVEKQSDAWDLYHPKYPFGQIPDLEKTENPAHILQYDAARKNNAVLVDHSLEDVPRLLTSAELIRGMLATNAYAGSSGGGYKSGPLCVRPVSILEGTTLEETILLNLLILGKPVEPFSWSEYGKPYKASAASQLTVVRRYLWTSRAIRFIVDPSGQGARTIMLSPGNSLPEASDEGSEDPMIPLRLKADGKAYTYLRVTSERALWRSADILLATGDVGKPVKALHQLGLLVRRGLIPEDAQISLRFCAVGGDAQGPSTELWRDELLPFGVTLLRDDTRYSELTAAIQAAEEGAKSLGGRLYGFAMRYLQNGGDSSPNPDDAKRLKDEIAPDLAGYWAHLAESGERIAMDDFDKATWPAVIKEASKSTFYSAVNMLSPDARRFRAQFAREPQSDDSKPAKKSKKGKAS